MNMDVADWANPLDKEYAVWKYTTKVGFDYEAAMAKTEALIPEMNALLLELEPLIRGKPEVRMVRWVRQIGGVEVILSHLPPPVHLYTTSE
jgi:hypothetical protein